MKKLILIILIAVALIACSPDSPAAPATPDTEFTWIPPTTNVDGTPLNDLAGFKIYCGVSSGSYSVIIDILDPLQTSALLSAIPDGDWFCAMTAFDTALQEGQYSNEIFRTILGGIRPLTDVPGVVGGFGTR